MKKQKFYTELAYILGIYILSFGAALMEAADYGLSMVVAPAYLFYLKLSEILPFFTFGMAEYTIQAVLLLLLAVILRRFKVSYLFSFVTAVLYGFVLDLNMLIVANIPCETVPVRVIFYLLGLICCSVGVSFVFHTYIPPEVYELFVKETSAKYNINIHKFKTAYDCVSCVLAILLSFCFFGLGHFEGVKAGTILCALTNGWLVGCCTHLFEKKFEFADRFRLRAYFEK